MALPECPEGNDGQSQDKGEARDNQDCQDKVLDLKMNKDCLERVLDLKSRLSDKVLDINIYQDCRQDIVFNIGRSNDCQEKGLDVCISWNA